LPPLFTLTKLAETDVFNALHQLAAIYCPLSFPFSQELSSQAKHGITQLDVDSGYTSGNEDEDTNDSKQTITTLRADAFERSFVERWLTGFISRAETLSIFSSEESSQRAVDQAAYIFESLFTPAVDEDEQDTSFMRNFSFDTHIPGQTKGKIKVQLNDELAGTTDTDYQDVGLQSWGASIVFSEIMCASPARFGLRDIPSTSDTRIIELGAGTGLVSLALGKLLPSLGVRDSKIIATDYHPAVLDNLQSNIALNYPKDGSSSISAFPLDWASPSQEHPFDVPATMLLATDVVYAPEHALLLRDCATQLLSDDGTFWMLITIRSEGKFAGILNTVEAAFGASDRPRGKSGRRLEILERERLDKRSGVGRGDESGYELFRIGWS
jgi:predicted nicotinamide N-methyase